MRMVRFYQTSVGKKVVVAITGLVMFGFLIGHMAGNLKVFMGAAAFDHYAHMLRTLFSDFIGEMTFLWIARIGLLAAIALHIVTVIQLTRQNRAARPQKYARPGRRAASWSGRFMMVSGLLLLAFIIFHILHFTTGTIRPTPFEHGKVYANVHGAFGQWWIVAIYLFGIALVGWHLFHGVWSLFQTLGLNNPDRGKFFKSFSAGSAVVLFLGFALVPTSFFVGVVEDVPLDHAHSADIVHQESAESADDILPVSDAQPAEAH